MNSQNKVIKKADVQSKFLKNTKGMANELIELARENLKNVFGFDLCESKKKDSKIFC